MKKFLLIMSLFFMALDAEEDCGIYPCETNFYAKISSGVNFLQNKNKSTYEPGYLIAGSLGYSWRYGLSLEAEYAFRRNAIKKIHFYGEGSSKHGHFQTSSYMLNLLWNLPSCAFWNTQPFIGAGIGDDFQQIRSSNSRIRFNQKWHHLSWQLMAGLARPIFHNTDLTLEYKFHQGGCHFYNHFISIGALYKFGSSR